VIAASAHRALAALTAFTTCAIEDQPTARHAACFALRLLAVYFTPSASKHGPGCLSARKELEFAGRRQALARLSDAVATGGALAAGDVAVLRELAGVARVAAA
jgi:hypothetical protein